MPLVINGVDVLLNGATTILIWHFCFIKQYLVDSFGLRLYRPKFGSKVRVSPCYEIGYLFRHVELRKAP